MGTRFVGIPHFPVLQTRSTYPPSQPPRRPSQDRDLAFDRTDVLLQRLNDLTAQILGGRRVEDHKVNAMHQLLDEMEELVSNPTTHEPDRKTDEFETSLADSWDEESFEDTKDSDSMASETPVDSPAEHSLDDYISASDGRELLVRISKVVEELQARHLEMKHLHDLSLLKAEEAAERILALETEVEQAEAEIIADQSELTYLKVQLKALEVLALRYIPSHDEGLRDEFHRWKLDWADVHDRYKRRRRKDEASSPLPVSPMRDK